MIVMDNHNLVIGWGYNMISESEKAFYENLQHPIVLFSVYEEGSTQN